jgi:hypothetical protein
MARRQRRRRVRGERTGECRHAWNEIHGRLQLCDNVSVTCAGVNYRCLTWEIRPTV